MLADAAAVYARRDGRTALELRGKEMRLSEMVDFDGSSWYAQGQTAVMVSLHGPTLAKNEAYDTCLLRVRVQHARGIAPSAGGAEKLIYDEVRLETLTRTDALALESLLESTLEAVFMRERFPRCVLVVDVLVVQDDGSLPAVALNAVMAALLDAGLPCRTTMAAVCVAAVTRPHDDNNDALIEYLLDPTRAEESLGLTYAGSTATHNASTSTSSAFPAGEQPNANTMLFLGKDAATARQDQYRCVSAGVFVFSNPACGGGLLAQLVRRVGAASVRSGMSGVTVEAYAAMMKLAERAATVLFNFFRQCNVAE